MTKIQDAMMRAALASAEGMNANEAAGGACDFCGRRVQLPYTFYFGDTDSVHSLEGIDPETLETAAVIYHNSPDWAACDDCAPVVRQGDPQALTDHVMQFEEVKNPAFVADGILTLYTDLYKKGFREEKEPE